MELLSAARFVVDHAPGDVTGFPAEPPDSSASKQRQSPAEEQPSYTTHSETSSRDLDLDAAGDPSAWRQEVAARLNRYRERRQPRAPRYPSLRLRFEPAQPDWTARDNTEVPTHRANPWRKTAGKWPSLPSRNLRTSQRSHCPLS